ncbi:MAG: hypothetical protein AAGA85_09925 [Bacteroidota bacterium]
MSVKQEFDEAATSYKKAFKQLQVISREFIWGRTITFALLLILLIGTDVLLFASIGGILLASVFLFLSNRDQVNERKKNLQRNLWELNEEEQQRLDGTLESVHTGDEYLDVGHPFAQDLDIFGKNSLFASVNRSYLRSSRRKLAELLTSPVDLRQVEARQVAIQELKDNREWRQSLQATLRSLSSEKVNEEALPENLKSLPGSRLASWLAVFLGLSTLIVLILISTSMVPSLAAWIMVFINLLVLLYFNLRLQNQALKTDHLQKFLVAFLQALRIISEGEFKSPSLIKLQSYIGTRAIKEIGILRQVVFLLDSRTNILWPLINVVLLIDLHTFSLLQKWIQRNEGQFQRWLQCVNEFEALCSMATFADVNVDFTIPVLTEDKMMWTGTRVGHPLIPSSERVTNDFDLHQPINLVTGSNMSGKSTFLRTIGLNSVMAWVGLPVCAHHLKCSKFTIYTSMRTQDDLSSGTSSFYAELKRIRGLFDLEEASKDTVLFLLDEILKGTNSQDRHSGAQGIITRLLGKDAVGFISTHDLALADEYEAHEHVKNYSFNSQLVKDRLEFDYQLRPGKCQNTNASILMKQLNIID